MSLDDDRDRPGSGRAVSAAYFTSQCDLPLGIGQDKLYEALVLDDSKRPWRLLTWVLINIPIEGGYPALTQLFGARTGSTSEQLDRRHPRASDRCRSDRQQANKRRPKPNHLGAGICNP
jgi:hypothetical protein